MKKFFVIAAAVLLTLVIAVPIGTKILGPRLIVVAAPSGRPIGEFDVPRPETSQLAVSIGVPLVMLNEIANQKVPQEFEGAEQKDFHKNLRGGGYAWKVVRGPIEFQNTGSNLAFGTAIEGAARFQGNLDAKFIQIPLNTTAQLAGTAGGTLSPTIAPDWSISPNLAPALNLTQASLSLGGLGQMDISDILGGSVGQYIQTEAQKLAPSLRNSLNLRDQVELLWKEAYVIEKVNDDPNIWISVTPTQIKMAPIDYTDPEQLSLVVAIQSETFLINREPTKPVPAPLPDLSPQTESLGTDLNIPIIVSITELNEALQGESFQIDTGVGTKLDIQGIEAAVGQGGMLNLKLTLNASQGLIGRGVEGEIWIEGQPVIDYEDQSLGFSQVDFTVETKSKLTTGATWLLEELLIKTLESQLRINLGDYQAELSEEIDKAIVEAELPEGIEFSINDLDIKLADIYTITRPFPNADESPGLVVVINATGTLETQITQIELGPTAEPQTER